MKNNKLNLKLNERYTLIKPNELVPETFNFTLVNFYYGNYAQYKNCLYLIVKLKNHRKSTRIIITTNETAYILKGWDFTKSWRKENISNNMSLLHRLTINDMPKKDIIYIKEFS